MTSSKPPNHSLEIACTPQIRNRCAFCLDTIGKGRTFCRIVSQLSGSAQSETTLCANCLRRTHQYLVSIETEGEAPPPQDPTCPPWGPTSPGPLEGSSKREEPESLDLEEGEDPSSSAGCAGSTGETG